MEPDLLAIIDFDWTAIDERVREPEGTRLVLRTCARTLVADTAGEVAALLGEVDAWTRAGGYAFGAVSYEAASAFDAAFPVRETRDAPLAVFHLATTDQVERTRKAPVGDARPLELPHWSASVAPDGHALQVEEIRRRIADGDVYQVNLTIRLQSGWPGVSNGGRAGGGSALALYETLIAAHAPPFGAYVEAAGHKLLSLSPELFLARNGTRLTTRPMKGTARRGRYPEEDANRREALLASSKDRAENVMIVDLLRNDLGRVARVGGVDVPRLLDAERHSTVWQLTSTVTADSDEPVPLGSAFAALFPCGSVTGAPKIAAMQQIALLEPMNRGFYCGAIGVVWPGSDYVFNVAIRTIEADDTRGTAVFGTGGGITWDSDPAAEYAELLAKAALLGRPRPRFDLLETLRLEDGQYPLLERHIARLTRSAEHLNRYVDAAAVRQRLADVAATCPLGLHRVRLTVAPDGSAAVSHVPFPEGIAPWNVKLATEPVDSSDTFLFHKTTHREVYEAAARAHPDADDVLLWNQEGCLTELTRANLVLEIGGELLTPPVADGLLAGVQRGLLLDERKVRERSLRAADIRLATRCWAVNALRGMVPIIVWSD